MDCDSPSIRGWAWGGGSGRVFPGSGSSTGAKAGRWKHPGLSVHWLGSSRQSDES